MLKNVLSIGYVSELIDLSIQKVAVSCVRGWQHCATPTAGVIAVVRKALWCRV